MSRFGRDSRGGVLVEFAVALPIIIVLSIGSLEFLMAMWQRGAALKAAQAGARYAVVSDPVPSDLFTLSDGTDLFSGTLVLGGACTKPDGTANTECGSFVDTVCVGSTSTCSNGRTFRATQFGQILAAMQVVLPGLTAANVNVGYSAAGLGFAGSPNKIPVIVKVSVVCYAYTLPFLSALNVLATPAASGGCPAGWVIKDAVVALPSEDLNSAFP